MAIGGILKTLCKEYNLFTVMNLDILFTNIQSVVKNPSPDHKIDSFQQIVHDIRRVLKIQSLDDIVRLYKSMDVNGDGITDFENFQRVVLHYAKGMPDITIRNFFSFLSNSNKNILAFENFYTNLTTTLPLSQSESPKKIPINSSNINNEEGSKILEDIDFLNSSKSMAKIINKTKWAESLIEDIVQLFKKKGYYVEDFFDSKDSKMNLSIFKLKFLEFGFYHDDLHRFVDQLHCQENPLYVDLKLFQECFDYYHEKLRKKNFKTTADEIIQKIGYAITEQRKTFESIFNHYDYSRNRLLHTKALELALQNELKLYFSSNELHILFNKIKNQDNYISLDSLRVELGNMSNTTSDNVKESNIDYSRANDILKDLRYILKKRNINLTQLFKGFDTDKSDSIEFKEFIKIISYINNFIVRDDIIALFKVFDRDENGQISSSEFLSQLNLSNLDEISPELAVILLEDIRKRISSFRPHEMVYVMKLINTELDNGIKKPVFELFIRYFVKAATQEQISGMFNYLDNHNQATLDFFEFCVFFKLNHMLKAKNHDEWLIQNLKWAIDIFKNIAGQLIIKKVAFQEYFSKILMIKSEEFKKMLTNLNIRIREEDFKAISIILADKTDMNFVNLEDFYCVYKAFNIEEIEKKVTKSIKI